MENKNIVIITSTIRSGSTLLKALLGTAPNVSHLPEINFQKFKNKEEIYKVSNKDVIVLKRPALLYENRIYPQLRVQGAKKIILFREPFDNISSMKKKVIGKKFSFLRVFFNKWLIKRYWYKYLVNKWLVKRYWYGVYKNLLEKFKDDENAFFVKYEDLVNNPEKITKELFDFIGASMDEGVKSYTPPHGGWKWGQDDESSYIKSLNVQKKQRHRDKVLNEIIKQDGEVEKLIEEYNMICVSPDDNKERNTSGLLLENEIDEQRNFFPVKSEKSKIP